MISQIENGRSAASLETLEDIAEFFGSACRHAIRAAAVQRLALRSATSYKANMLLSAL
jgi:hypothetical protein